MNKLDKPSHGWEESIREYEYDKGGQRRLVKSTEERQSNSARKDYILRVIGSLAVVVSFLALLLNFWQQSKQLKFQTDQQRALFQLTIFDKAITNINSLAISAVRQDSVYNNAKYLFQTETVPKLTLLNDRQLSEICSDINLVVSMMEELHIVGVDLQNEFYNRKKSLLLLQKVHADSLYIISGKIPEDIKTISEFKNDNHKISNSLSLLETKTYKGGITRIAGIDSSIKILHENLITTLSQIRTEGQSIIHQLSHADGTTNPAYHPDYHNSLHFTINSNKESLKQDFRETVVLINLKDKLFAVLPRLQDLAIKRMASINVLLTN